MFPFIKAVISIKKAKLLGLMFLCALIALVVVAAAVAGITWIADRFVIIERGWLDSMVNWAVGTLAGIGGWFMLPVLMVIIAGLFQETVIQRVEHNFYPDSVERGHLKFWPEIWHDIKFTVWALFLNLLVLPLSLIGIGLIVAILLNSYLLGREFFESAAGYHVGKPRAREIGKKHRKAVYGGGLIITTMTLLPILNLFVPILAIVWMVHVYHYLSRLHSYTSCRGI